MPLSAPVVFPLLSIVQTPEGPRCACGDAACSRVGKHPAVPWAELAYGDEVPRPEPGAGAGIKTGAAPKGSGIFVVDCDSDTAEEAFHALGDVPDTFTVSTPRGRHFYFAHPGFPVGNSAGVLAKGVDVRGEGGFVVAPGSPHKTGAKYYVEYDDPPAPAPAWLLEWLRSRAAPAEVKTYPGDVAPGTSEHTHRRELYTKYLRETKPCVQGEAGDQRLFEVVQRGAYDLQLPTADVLELVREHFDPRCSPPWGDELGERVAHKAHSAKTGSTRARVEPLPADLGHLVLEMPPLPSPARKKPNEVDGDGFFWDRWDETVEPPRYLVDALIPVATVGMFVAHGSSLKTWAVLSVGSAIANGAPWLGRFCVRKGRVLVADYESGLYELRRRMHLLHKGRVEGFGAWPYPDLRIDDVEFWNKAATVPDLACLAIDSLAAGAPGVDENDTIAATPLHLAARFAEKTGAAVIFVHHSKKDDGGDARKAVRGSTAIFAGLDWCYAFENVEETRDFRRMSMVCTKPCMGRKPDPVPLELTDAKGLSLYEDTSKPSRESSSAEIQSAILLRVEAAGSIATKAKIAAAVGLRNERVSPEVDELVARRELVQIEGVGYVIDGPEQRLRRVFEVLEGSQNWRSEAEIANAAFVTTRDVKKMSKDGFLARSAEGRFIAFPKSGILTPPERTRERAFPTSGTPERDG